MTEIKPTAKVGQINHLAPHKRVASNKTRPEVDKHNLNMVLALTKELPLEELQDKESELPLPNLRADPKLETEVLPQTQAILQVITFLELEPHNKRHQLPKIQLLLP